MPLEGHTVIPCSGLAEDAEPESNHEETAEEPRTWNILFPKKPTFFF